MEMEIYEVIPVTFDGPSHVVITETEGDAKIMMVKLFDQRAPKYSYTISDFEAEAIDPNSFPTATIIV